MAPYCHTYLEHVAVVVEVLAELARVPIIEDEPMGYAVER